MDAACPLRLARRANTSWRAAIARFRPSLHDFADKRLGEAVAEYLIRERVAVEETIALYEERRAFSQGMTSGEARLRPHRFRENLVCLFLTDTYKA